MRAQTILQELRALGVSFHADRGRLRIKALPRILTDELKAEIAQLNSAIISCLERESAPTRPRKLKKERLRAARDVLSQLESAGIVIDLEADGLIMRKFGGLIHSGLLLMAREYSEEIRRLKSWDNGPSSE